MLCFLLSHPQTTRKEVLTARGPSSTSAAPRPTSAPTSGTSSGSSSPIERVARRRGSSAAMASAWCSPPRGWRVTSPSWTRSPKRVGEPGGTRRPGWAALALPVGDRAVPGDYMAGLDDRWIIYERISSATVRHDRGARRRTPPRPGDPNKPSGGPTRSGRERRAGGAGAPATGWGLTRDRGTGSAARTSAERLLSVLAEAGRRASTTPGACSRRWG